jgi:hypothetical protein
MTPRQKNGKHEGSNLTASWPEGAREIALEQLSRILDSHHFRSTKRCSQFLRFVVEHASRNDLECLKERTLGVAVFDRDPNYDTNEDPVVRIAAGEVRKRLAQYYQQPGHEWEPRIAVPAGSYVPEFHAAPSKPEEPAPAAQLQHVEVAPLSDLDLNVQTAAIAISRRRKWAWAAGAAMALIALSATLVFLLSRQTDLDRFWAPILEPKGVLLVCLGQPKAYFFNTSAQAELDRWFEHRNETGVRPPSFNSIPLDDVVPAWDRVISVHDAQAFARLSALFAHAGKDVQLRGGRSVSLTDLRGRPLVLIGAFSNDWTLSLAGELRFYFDVDRENGGSIVRDRQHPKMLDWKIQKAWPQQNIPIDYAVVSRVVNPVTEQTVVIAAGITHFGTQAAGEFLTNPRYFGEALRDAPRDWPRKNMQVVLSTQVMSGNAGPPKVLAVYAW